MNSRVIIGLVVAVVAVSIIAAFGSGEFTSEPEPVETMYTADEVLKGKVITRILTEQVGLSSSP